MSQMYLKLSRGKHFMYDPLSIKEKKGFGTKNSAAAVFDSGLLCEVWEVLAIKTVLLKNAKTFRAHKYLNSLHWFVKALTELTRSFTWPPYTQLNDIKCKRWNISSLCSVDKIPMSINRSLKGHIIKTTEIRGSNNTTALLFFKYMAFWVCTNNIMNPNNGTKICSLDEWGF